MSDLDPAMLAQVVGHLHNRYPDSGGSDELLEFLYRHGTELDAIMYRALFWPTFVEIEGVVVWQGMITEDTRSEVAHMLATGQDRTSVEKAFNYIELPQLFGDPDPRGRIDDEVFDDLAHSLCEMWKARLDLLFPERQFVVEFVPGDNSTGEEVGLMFYEAPSGLQ